MITARIEPDAQPGDYPHLVVLVDDECPGDYNRRVIYAAPSIKVAEAVRDAATNTIGAVRSLDYARAGGREVTR